MRRAEQPLPPRLATGGLDAEMMTAEASDTPLLPAASAQPRFRNAVTGDAVAGDAVLVEPRPMVRARESLLHARLALPVAWRVHAWCSSTNHREIAPLCASNVSCTNMDASHPNITAKWRKHRADRGWWIPRSWFNDLVFSRSFWAAPAFTAPHLLLFQVDAVFCPSPTVPLDAWVAQPYGFVGAPWGVDQTNHSDAGSTCRAVHAAVLRYHKERRSRPAEMAPPIRCVGNSGLSLWRRATVLRALHLLANTTELRSLKPAGPLRGFDVWFSAVANGPLRRTWAQGAESAALPLEAEAERFSVEMVYAGSFTPVGVHNPFPYLSAARLAELGQRCPPLEEIKRQPGVCAASKAECDKRADAARRGSVRTLLGRAWRGRGPFSLLRSLPVAAKIFVLDLVLCAVLCCACAYMVASRDDFD